MRRSIRDRFVRLNDVKTLKKLATRAVGLSLALLVAALGASGAAGARDLDPLRTRAQSIGDEITALEQRLTGLRARQSRLESEIAGLAAQISSLSSEIHDVEWAYERARDRYVERAVEIYKGGSSARLEMLLSTTSLNDLMDAAAITGAAADIDATRLSELITARDRAQGAQARLDDRKQRLMAAERDVAAVTDEIAAGVAERKAIFAALNREIEELEARARREAARAQEQASDELDHILTGAGPSGHIPGDFASTGVSFEGEASWYGPGFEGNPTASGQIFDSSKYTAASLDLPLGTWLYVEHEGRGVVVLINDRGPYVDGRVLDLSRAAAEAIGITGVGWVRATIVIKRG